MLRSLRALVLGALLAFSAVGCASDPALYDVSVEPSLITPDRDGDRDVARILYHVGRTSRVEITLIGSDGTAHVLRDNRMRHPADEAYEALFGGVIGERMLPDDDYVLRLRATPVEGGQDVVLEASLGIRGGDASPPALAGFSVQPSRFTPNQDGLDDRVAISYGLDEPAEVTLSLLDEQGEWVADILESIDSASEPGEPGPHVYDFDAGVDADAPPPADGLYTVEAVAKDASGNVTRESRPLEIMHGGRPQAQLMGDVQWSHRRLILGETLTFTATVKNTGNTPIRTRGPEPGFVFDTSQTFNQPATPSYLILAKSQDGRAASLRVPVADAEIRLAVAPPDGLPRPSPELVTAEVGAGETLSTTPTTAEPELADGSTGERNEAPAVAADTDAGSPSPKTVRLCGLVVDAQTEAPVVGAEVHAFQADGDLGTMVLSDSAGAFCFEALPVAGEHSQNYARSPGALRIGVEHDARRTDVDHPWRWQVGPTSALEVCHAERESYLCLPPQATVAVSGSLRFDEPTFGNAFRIWLTLMHEDVKRMHGPYQPEQLFLDYDPEAVGNR